MMRYCICTLVFILFAAYSSCHKNTPDRSPVLISPLQNQLIAQGCGCYLESTSRDLKRKFFYWNNFSTQQIVSIDNKDIIFEKCTIKGKQKTIGDTQLIICQGDSIEVIISLTLTSLCVQKSCESTMVKGTIKVINSKNNEKYDEMNNLVGACGC